jgi:hypothetical protein
MKTILLRETIAVMLFAACSLLRAEEAPKTIMFVCEHGTAKSLIAASFFNRLAAEQKIGYRAIARGTAWIEHHQLAGCPTGLCGLRKSQSGHATAD